LARHGLPARFAYPSWPGRLLPPAGAALLRRAGPAWSGRIAGVAAIASSRVLMFAGWRAIGCGGRG
jgi:hypothetical protein